MRRSAARRGFAARPRCPGSRARCAGRSGRAGPRAAGTCPRTRSGSPSRGGGRGTGSRRVTPSTVTCCSAIASSSADCVFGVARLISSTRTTLAKIGPGRNSNSRVCWLKIESPVTSVGWRSGVHWIRCGIAPSMLCAIARASTVFAVPGTSSSRTWPSQSERREHELDLVSLAVDDGLDVVDQTSCDRARSREAVRARGHGYGRLHGRDASCGRLVRGIVIEARYFYERTARWLACSPYVLIRAQAPLVRARVARTDPD